MIKKRILLTLEPLLISGVVSVGSAQASPPENVRERWEQQCLMRQEKLDRILPEVMRENGIDMWIVAERDGAYDPNADLLGGGYSNGIGYYVFTDRSAGRIERTTFRIEGPELNDCRSYDTIGSTQELRKFVAERDPKRIAINTATEIGAADGLSYSVHQHLVDELGPSYAKRLISAEKLVSDFRSRHVVSEIAAFAQAGEYSRALVQRGLSNEVITPDKTTLRDVAWWLRQQQVNHGLGTSFGQPSVYVLGPGVRHISDDHIIRHGELLAVDWGVVYEGQYTDMKRLAYVLKSGEDAPPPGVQHAFDKGVAVRTMIYQTIKPGVTAGATLKLLNEKVAAMPGYHADEKWNHPIEDSSVTDVFIGSHSTGDLGHGSGPSIADFNSLQMAFLVRPTNFFAIEFFSYSNIPEWGPKKVTLPLEDDAIVTERGVEWPYPPNDHLLLVK
jgi:Xaa-Pro aminopeptidase